MPLPALFVSHGAPTLAIEPSQAHDFLKTVARQLPRPDAILCVSAHWESDRPALSLAERPDTIHDFGGFPDALYRLFYPAPGAPALASRAQGLLRQVGERVALSESRGLDHGAWVPLMLMYPQADIPVTQLSVQTARGAATHLALGRALAPLRKEGVLVLGSGGAVHNLGHWFEDPAGVPDWAVAFDDWLCAKVLAGAVEDLVAYRGKAPEAAKAHPTEEHFLPFHVALGAGTGGGNRVLHRSYHGSLAMTAFAFGGG